MYNVNEIKELIAILEGSSLAVLELSKEDGSKIRLEKPQTSQQVVAAAPTVQQAAAPAKVDSGKSIKAPIVGVFYAAPSPTSDPYVAVGKKVKKGDTVCIIEAMKCMNEIQAEEDGEITEILAKDGELVEYGQPLFKIN
jgi:acetyl-CoA carboxylase biotin carboxyl carrier protein